LPLRKAGQKKGLKIHRMDCVVSKLLIEEEEGVFVEKSRGMSSPVLVVLHNLFVRGWYIFVLDGSQVVQVQRE